MNAKNMKETETKSTGQYIAVNFTDIEEVHSLHFPHFILSSLTVLAVMYRFRYRIPHFSSKRAYIG